MWMTTVQEGGNTYSVAFRGGEIPNAGAQLFNNPRHPTVVADTQRTLLRLKELEPPDLFLHNHPQDPPRELDPALPVDPRCVTCFDAEGWRSYVTRVEASFEAMLREAEAPPDPQPPVASTQEVGAQELERGTWTGTASPPQGSPSVAVTYEVGETDGALSIVMSVSGESTVLHDVKLNGDELTFWWDPGGGVDCTLLRKEDGSFDGICTERTGPGGEGTLTMLPPSGEDSS